MKPLIILLCIHLLLASLVRAHSAPGVRPCGAKCSLKLCDSSKAYLSAPGLLLHNICSQTGPISIISAGEARISRRPFKLVAPISALEFKGRNIFPSTFFRAIRHGKLTKLITTAADRRAVEALHGVCVVIPVSRWQQGRTIGRNGCIGFRVAIPEIIIELIWTSNDDLDLFVKEPDGSDVHFSKNSTTGRLLRDVNRKSCNRDVRKGGRESVVYLTNVPVQRGNYMVHAEHTKTCGNGPTNWLVRVVVNGVVVASRRGSSSIVDGAVVERSRLTFEV